MPITYDFAILMARRQPQVADEIGAYNKGWEVIKASGEKLSNIRIDLQRELTDSEKAYLQA